MKKSMISLVYLALGLVLLVVGLYLVKSNGNVTGMMVVLPYWLVGIGCALLGNGVGNIIRKRAYKNQPEMEKKIKIEKSDERNIAIGNYAKAKAYDMMVIVFGVIMLCFSLMGINMWAILLFVTAYVFIVGYNIYYRFKCEKEM